MWIREKTTGERILLMKYYPKTGWYLYYVDTVMEIHNKFDAILQKLSYDKTFGPTSFELEFETTEEEAKACASKSTGERG